MRRVILLVAVMALAVLLAAPSALASGPKVTRTPFDFTVVLDDNCGFPVDARFEGVNVEKRWINEDGSVRIL